MATADAPPVVLVHGWGGSFQTTWRQSGFAELLADAGRPVIGVDLLGHGEAPKPHDPEAYRNMTARIAEALPDEPVDIVGFSMGAMTTLRLAVSEPDRFRRIVLAGIGQGVFERDEERRLSIIAGVEGTADPDDNVARLFGQYAGQPGNDRVALAAVLKRPDEGPFTPDELAAVTCPVLVVIGDRDFGGPAEPLVAALPDARGVTLRNVDHFATPEAFGFIDAVLEFLDAIPRMNVPVTTDVGLAVERLTHGGLVAIPTETVYGLGADADDPAAVGRIFAAKNRPPDHPLIVHIALDWLGKWAAVLPPTAAVLAEACWPGPLTLLLPRAGRVVDAVTGGRDTVGLRVPAHPMTQELLARSGRGIAAPSANRFGRVSPTTAEHVVTDLGRFLDPDRDVVLDGGPSPIGVESTIIDCTTDPPQLLRAGGIPTEDVERLLDAAVDDASGPSRAAGMLASHYAPHARVTLVPDSRAAAAQAALLEREGGPATVLDYGDDLVTYARRLYAELRAADAAGADHIVAVLPPPRGLGHAIRDRLTKAAAR